MAQLGGPVPRLLDGPRHRTHKTQWQITRDILKLKLKPTFYNAQRAWNILGYHGVGRKPTEQVFYRQINNLWRFLANEDIGDSCFYVSYKAKKARSCILDALRTLGFWDARWNVDVPDIYLGPEYSVVNWANVPRPRPNGGGTGKGDAREFYTTIATRTRPPPDGIEGRRYQEKILWRRFHRYQGFMAKDEDDAERYFRTIHVPEGPDSLWHSVA